MVARASHQRSSLLAAVCSLFVFAACEQSPLVAPTGSTIVITASTNVLPVNASTQIVAQVLEAAGTPPHSGTIVTFTTTLGSFEPFEVSTDAGGRAVVRFLTGPANGSAVITATSGAATTGTNGSIRISIGTAAVGRVSVNASPALVPANGGSTTITASVFDVNGNTLRSAPVSFTTTAGTLSASLVEADANGAASTTLTTAQQATVTASVGAQAPAPPATGGGGGAGGGGAGGGGAGGGTGAGAASSGQASGSVVVNIASAPALVITPPTTPPSAGLPAAFTFAVTPAAQNGSAIRDLRVNWGDGESSNLGAVTGTANASHVYEDDGTFTVTATVTDVSGNSVSVSTSVAVIPVPRPTVVVTASPSNTFVNNEVTITIQVTAAPGIGIQRTTISFGDGETRELGGAASISVPKQYTSPGVFTVRVNVLDTAGNVTEGTTRVSVN